MDNEIIKKEDGIYNHLHANEIIKSCQIDFFNNRSFAQAEYYYDVPNKKPYLCTVSCPKNYLQMVLEIAEDKLEYLNSKECNDKIKRGIIDGCKKINCSYL